MSTVRFTLIAVGLFALAFSGMVWTHKGFPVAAMRAEPPRPDASLPVEASVPQAPRPEAESTKTVQSDGDRERDKLRLALWQAAIGYKLLPCDAAMKKNLVEALTGYTRAWAEMAGCPAGGCSGDNQRMDAAAAAFKTAADDRVHGALREAFAQGGIGRADFPSAIRGNVFMWTGMPSGGDPNACTAARRADNTRR